MSNYGGRHRTASVNSRGSRRSNPSQTGRTRMGSYGALTGPTLTPSNDQMFEACAATASFFLYAQRNVILSLHHDTLDIDRRFERHREDVRWIEVDNTSDRGSGRLAVSYDVSQTAIVWDIMNGEELARFASYEDIRVATWMKDGQIAFGNDQGNIILFDHETKEHYSRKTIYDPITALAPSMDCRVFAVGYANGSILIAALQPQFNIIHSLSTQRHPSPINGLSWHGSSSKSKSEMLASQTMDGDLRVWSIPKSSNGDQPSVIRTFQQGGMERTATPCWFAWSKMGRIVQYIDGQTQAWDVRTKKVTYESVPTIEGVVGIANYGPHAVLFTIGRNHTVQQYDLNPSGTPSVVRNVQHVPAVSLPPSPPFSDGEHIRPRMPAVTPAITDQRQSNNLPLYMDTASSEGGEGYGLMSPLERITHDAPSEQSEQSEQSEEERDMVMPLSPTSSRSSNVSQNSDKKPKLSYPSRRERQLSSRLRPPSPGIQSTRSGSTILTSSSTASGGRRSRSSKLRQEVLRSPEEGKKGLDLFPFVRAHLVDVPFRPPRYAEGPKTPDMLRVEMLRTVFGWEGDVQDLIRDEISRHAPGSASAVLLAKWLGDLGAEHASSMVGSESMTSSDWMLLALSAVGGGAQKKVGDAFVTRLLEKGDLHPAVAILLGLGEFQEAIEIYVSRKYYLEAVLLCCLLTPHDWKRQSHLVRKWGEMAITSKQAELAVRCFACTSVDSSENWFSPASKDAVYEAQMQYMGPSSAGLSPGASSQTSSLGAFSNRRHPRQAGLKLITDFSGPAQKSGKLPASALDDRTPLLMTGVTPIDQTFSPAGRTGRKQNREPQSSMTATPGGLTSMRMPSRGRWVDELVTPIGNDRTAAPESAIRIKGQPSALLAPKRFPNATQEDHLPSPAAGVFSKESRRERNMSRDRKPHDLHVETNDIVVIDSGMPSGATVSSSRTRSTLPGRSPALRMGAATPDLPLSAKIASLDAYVNSLATQEERAAEYQGARPESRTRQTRTVSRNRAPSETGSKRYVRPGKRSPSSPVSMSPDDPGLQIQVQTGDYDYEKLHRVISPTESSYSKRSIDTNISKPRGRAKANSVSYGATGSGRSSSKAPRRGESLDPVARTASRNRRRDASRPVTPERETGRRGRSVVAGDISARRSPDSPVSMTVGGDDEPRTTRRREQSVGDKVRARATSQNRQAGSPDRFRSRVRATSMSRRASPDEQPRMRSQSAKPAERRAASPSGRTSRQASRPRIPRLQTDFSDGKKHLAAQELEARRLSLARRPSAPAIPHPDEIGYQRSASSLGFVTNYDDPVARSHTVNPEMTSRHMSNRMTGSERMVPSEYEILRSQTVDPEAQRRQIGLPSTPKAMRLPSRYGQHEAPAVPQIPSGYHEVPQNEQHLTLPSSTFTLPSISFDPVNRAASAPPEKYSPGHTRRGSRQERLTHSRMGSLNEIVVPPPPPPVSRDAIISYPAGVLESDIVVVRDSGTQEHILPQLQHLVQQHNPPPPPPPPAMAFRPISHVSNGSGGGVINIAIDEKTGAAVAQRGSIASQSSHARRPSADIAIISPHGYPSHEQIHPQQLQPNYYGAAPYESIRPPFERVGSAPPQSLHASSLSLDRALAGPPLQLLPSTTYQPSAPPAHYVHQNPSLTSGPRDPKQIRDAMTAEQLQFGMSAGPQLLPATTYLPERPQTAAPRSNVNMPRGLEEYRSPAKVTANMPPVSTQQGVGMFEGRPF